MQDLGGLFPFIMVLGVMYFLIIRPQMKEKEAHDKLVAGLAKDDRVVLRSGLHGRITAVDEDTALVEVAKNVHVTTDKDAVQRVIEPEASK